MIGFNLKDNTIFIKSFGDCFDEFLEVMRTYKVKFDWDIKSYLCTKRLFNLLVAELKPIDDLKFYPSYEQIKEFCKIKPEIEYYRTTLDTSLLKSPPIIGKSPYENFQSEDIKRIIGTNRIYIGNQPGTGKTYEVISSINHFQKTHNVKRVLIICPMNILLNWREELKTFYIDGISNDDFYIVDTKHRKPFESDCKFVAMTARSMLMLSDENHKKNNPSQYTKEAIKKRKKSKVDYRSIDIGISDWLGTDEGCLIVDESHNIKNYKSKSYKCISMQANKFKFRYLMSGTPFPKDIIDAYAQFEILDPSIINMDYDNYISYVAKIGTKYSKYAIAYVYPHREAEILKKLQPYMIRRYSDDVLDLPEHTMKLNYCELTDFQQDIYREVIRDTLTKIKEEKGGIQLKEIKMKYPYLIQALHNPCLLKDKFENTGNKLEKLLKKWKFNNNSKIPLVDDLMDIYINDDDRKVIIWDYHPLSLIQLNDHYKKYNPTLITADLKYDDRISVVENFKKNKKSKVLIVSFLLFSEGVNIVECSRNICFARDYQFNKFDQLVKRSHRIGQTKDVITNIPIILNSLEIQQNKILSDRDKLNSSINDEKFLNGSQIEKIFEGNTDIF